MKKLLTISFFFLFVANNSNLTAQMYSDAVLKKIDSLNDILSNPNSHDTLLIKSMDNLSEIIYIENIDTVTYFCFKMIEMAKKNLKTEITPREVFVYKKRMGSSYNNLGYVESYHGKIQLALEYYRESLKIREEINDFDGLSASYINLGSVYSDEGDLDKALEYYGKSLKLDKQLEDLNGASINYNNMGLLYLEKGNVEKAMYYVQKSLYIREELKDNFSIAISFNNMGGIYREMGDIDLAREYYHKSLKIYESINNKDGICHELAKLADINLRQGNLLLAKTQATKSLHLAQEIGYPKDIKLAAETLTEVYRIEKDGLKALKYYKLVVEIRDSLNNNVISKYKIRQEAKYEYEKKTVADSLKLAEIHGVQMAVEKTKAEEEEKKKKILMTGLLILGVLLILLFGRFRKAKKQKEFIEKQKIVVEKQHGQLEEVHQEISDSIQYAERLQKAILPPIKQFKAAFKNTFVLFKPKDVVSGDFYWLHTLNDDVYFAAADCTGHGVPGAMVSVVCGNALNRSVKEFKLKSPADILNKTRELVIETFSLSGTDVRDGMDIAICKLNKNILTYSGANNPLWLIRQTNLLSESELSSKSTVVLNDYALIEFKPNKQPIGLYEKMNDFSEVVIQLNKGDKVFVFSDGYADQFGGDKGKKMKYKAFKNLLLENNQLDMKSIQSKLESNFNDWKGNYEQLDDVVIIGVEID